MHQYPKHIKRLIREYTAQAYEIELGQALGELEQQFALWRAGQISAGELNDRVHAFHQGPSRELWSRYNARIDDMLVAQAIVTGWQASGPTHPSPQNLKPIFTYFWKVSTLSIEFGSSPDGHVL